MLGLAVLTQSANSAHAIDVLIENAGGFEIVFKGSPVPAHVALRGIHTHRPEVVLLDVSDWPAVSLLAIELRSAGTLVVGFSANWARPEQLIFEEAGICDLLREPFTFGELEACAYEGLHRERPVVNQNILAFLPAKAGGGCSTVALNTAGALVSGLDKKVLLIESDTRSGVLSFMLNQENRSGLREALAHAAALTPVEWRQHVAEVAGIHLLLSDPSRRLPILRWSDYYQLLRFLQKQYDYILVDLPEVINDATAEIVRTARGVLVVCEPELPSLKLTKQRCAELESCEIPRDSIHIVVNRWEHTRMTVKDVEQAIDRPVFATVPNDYTHVKNAVIKSRLVAADSPFAKGCAGLARKLGGLPESRAERLKFALLQSLGRLASH